MGCFRGLSCIPACFLRWKGPLPFDSACSGRRVGTASARLVKRLPAPTAGRRDWVTAGERNSCPAASGGRRVRTCFRPHGTVLACGTGARTHVQMAVICQLRCQPSCYRHKVSSTHGWALPLGEDWLPGGSAWRVRRAHHGAHRRCEAADKTPTTKASGCKLLLVSEVELSAEWASALVRNRKACQVRVRPLAPSRGGGAHFSGQRPVAVPAGRAFGLASILGRRSPERSRLRPWLNTQEQARELGICWTGARDSGGHTQRKWGILVSMRSRCPSYAKIRSTQGLVVLA